jgi:hypothetical protein
MKSVEARISGDDAFSDLTFTIRVLSWDLAMSRSVLNATKRCGSRTAFWLDPSCQDVCDRIPAFLAGNQACMRPRTSNIHIVGCSYGGDHIAPSSDAKSLERPGLGPRSLTAMSLTAFMTTKDDVLLLGNRSERSCPATTFRLLALLLETLNSHYSALTPPWPLVLADYESEASFSSGISAL